MYTLEQLQQKTLTELKEIGWQLNVLPEGDRRCRRNWIDALVGKNPPLLQLLETSPGVEAEPVQETIEYGRITGYLCRPKPIEIQATEPIETSPGIEVDSAKIRNDDYLDCPRCGTVGGLYATCPGQESVWETRCTCCDYLEPCIRHPFEDVRPFWVDRRREPIAPEAKITPDEVDGNKTETDGSTESATFVYLRADAHHPSRTAAQSHGSSDGIESSTSEHEGSDRVLATARDGERDKGRALRSQPIELTAAGFNDEQPPNRGDGRGLRKTELKVSQSAILFEGCANDFCDSPLTFSPRFLATYPPYFGEIHYKADDTGQLNLLEPETEDEPPDPDDFESMFAFWSAYDAWCERTDDDGEPLEVSMTSMREWAPCPLEWYEPDETNEINETVSGTLELSPPIAISDTSEFSIPTFDVWCDRPNDTDEPPDTGIFARLPKPKPPSFPPMVVVAGDRSCIKEFTRSATILSGRAPPGGDVMN